MRVATDMGGTFTDVVVEDDDATVRTYKHPTTPDAPLRGVLGGLGLAAEDLGLSLEEFLARTGTLMHGTTRSLNAVLTGNTARTAFVTTAGHPDILLFREGGRSEAFDFTHDYPGAYVPRSLTFEVDERIGADGEVVRALDDDSVRAAAAGIRTAGAEAVGVCLLWSVVEPAHEQRVAEILAEELPGVPLTLSHRLNPIVREYRRAASTVVDASLKPRMRGYLRELSASLHERGFRGRLLVTTSAGGVLDAEAVAEAPIHSLNSGPSMAPSAGRHYGAVDAHSDLAVVADTGGTSYDVSLVRRGRIPITREAWLGRPFLSDMTGFPAVDVRSVGAGGGSLAWVDDGGMLRVGPRSAGADPGPAAYGRGGTAPTVTDACLLLGFLSPDNFLGGAMRLDVDAARTAMRTAVAEPLGLTVTEAASAVLALTTEHMVGAIEEITLNQGVSARDAVLIGGGGAAGFNTVAIARRLGCRQVVLPALGPVLSAAGALMSDLKAEYATTRPTTTSDFDLEAVNRVLDDLRSRCEGFASGPGAGATHVDIELVAEARYPHQVWDLEVPLRVEKFGGPDDVATFLEDFHSTHRDFYAISDPGSAVQVVSWRARVACRIRDRAPVVATRPPAAGSPRTREIHLPGTGTVTAPVHAFDQVPDDAAVDGPAVVESPMTTVIVDPGARARRSENGSLLISLDDPRPDDPGRSRRDTGRDVS